MSGSVDNQQGFLDCPYYCEENVWQLCADPRTAGDSRRVALISNPARQVALWFQRAAEETGLPVVWDYHVVLFVHRADRWWTWDLDCVLGMPLAAERWLDATFAGTAELPASFAPHFRWIEAEHYHRHLASDRSHMRSADGGWLAPPPSWPCIGGGSNLMEWVDVEGPGPGRVLRLDALRQLLSADVSGEEITSAEIGGTLETR